MRGMIIVFFGGDTSFYLHRLQFCGRSCDVRIRHASSRCILLLVDTCMHVC